MPITDNRELIDDAEDLTNWIDEVEGTMNLTATPVSIQGTNSISQQESSSRGGILYDTLASNDWSNSVFYIWWNCLSSTLLSAKSAGGIAIRFAGSDPINEWFEIFVEGGDTYSGGWVMSVVDIEEARTKALQSPNTEGQASATPQATSGTQTIGVMFDVTGMPVGNDDNCFVDAIWRLPPGEAGIIIAGENTSVSPIRPYNWQDVVDAGDITDSTKAWGSITKANGVIRLNTPVQFGNDGSPDEGNHDFDDANQVIAWETQPVVDGFYGFDILGDGVNTQKFLAGVKTGSGDTAVGSQGWVVTAASDGPRWFIDAFDVDIEDTQFQGCLLIHSEAFDLDNLLTEMRSCQLVDGQRVDHSRIASPRSGAEFQKNTIVEADPVSFAENVVTSPFDVAYIHTADPDKIKENTFLFSERHAIEIQDEGTFSFEKNVFTGYGVDGSIDAALHYPPVPGQGDSIGGSGIVNPASVGSGFGVTDLRGGPFFWTGDAIQSVDVALIRRQGQPQFVSPDEPITLQLWYVTKLSPDNQNRPTDGDVFIAESETRFVSEVLPQSFGSPSTPIVMNFVFDPPVQPSPLSVSSPQKLVLVIRFDDANQISPANDGIAFFNPTTVSPQYFGGLALVSRNRTTSPKVWANSGTNPAWFEVFGLPDEPGALTLDVVDATNPTIHINRSPEDVTINNNVAVTLTNLQPGTEVRVYNNAVSPILEIDGVESVASPTEFTFSGAAALPVDIVIHHIDFVHIRIKDFTIPSTATSFPIDQQTDRTYLNP